MSHDFTIFLSEVDARRNQFLPFMCNVLLVQQQQQQVSSRILQMLRTEMTFKYYNLCLFLTNIKLRQGVESGYVNNVGNLALFLK